MSTATPPTAATTPTATFHAPTPFSLKDTGAEVLVLAADSPRQGIVARVNVCRQNDNTEPDGHETAEFIVRACNAHDGLLAVVRRLATWDANPNGDGIELGFICSAARAALNKAEPLPPRDGVEPGGMSEDECFDELERQCESDHRDGGPGRT